MRCGDVGCGENNVTFTLGWELQDQSMVDLSVVVDQHLIST